MILSFTNSIIDELFIFEHFNIDYAIQIRAEQKRGNSSKPVEIYAAQMRRKLALITFNFAVERIVVGSSFQTSRAGTEKVVFRYWMNACTKDM